MDLIIVGVDVGGSVQEVEGCSRVVALVNLFLLENLLFVGDCFFPCI